MKAKELERLARCRERLYELQLKEKTLEFSFSQEEELAEIKRQMDNLNKLKSTPVSPILSSANVSPHVNRTPPSNGDALDGRMFPVPPTLPFVISTNSVASARSENSSSPPDTRDSIELDIYLRSQRDRLSSPTFNSFRLPPIACDKGRLKLAVFREAMSHLFASRLNFTNTDVFNTNIKLNEFVNIETIKKLLLLKVKNAKLFQEACSFLHHIYTPLAPVKKFSGVPSYLEVDESDTDSDEEEFEHLTKIRNTIYLQCLEEML